MSWLWIVLGIIFGISVVVQILKDWARREDEKLQRERATYVTQQLRTDTSRVVDGKRYSTEGATLLASDPNGEINADILSANIGLKGLLYGKGDVKHLYRTQKGAFFLRAIPGDILPLTTDRAIKLYRRLPVKHLDEATAFSLVEDA